MRSLPTIIAALSAIAIADPACAHHSASIFDSESVVAFEGTVARFTWTNPHVYIYVESQDELGERVEWEIETDATPILTRSGWTPGSFAQGDQVAVRANPDRNARRKHALLISIQKDDGAIYSARSYFLRKPDDTASLARATDMSGTWEVGFVAYNRFYEGWAKVPLTAKAIAAQSAYDDRTEAPGAQCIALPSPGILVAPYLNEIVLGEEAILLRNERYNVERVVHVDGRGHPDSAEPTNQGHSIGWWEDGVLVVDTVHFAENRSPLVGRPARPGGVPGGRGKHVVERYALSEDGTRIVIDFVVEDPEHLAAPFSGTAEWYYAPHFEMLGFACDPENAKIFTRNR